ncbi:MAG TPA: addiction module protein [Gemmataceae bacterium]|nr:addiction module protein [Gemmataceae bacterium]
MTPETQALLEAALALPEDQRALLTERLLETLDEEGEEMPPEEELEDELEELTEEELLAELDRRRAEIEEGKVKPIPWSEIWLEE